MNENMFDFYVRDKLKVSIKIPRIVKVRIEQTYGLILAEEKSWSKKGMLTIVFFTVLLTIGLFNFLYSAFSKEFTNIPIFGSVIEYMGEHVIGDGTEKTIYNDGTIIYSFKYGKCKTYKNTSITIKEVRLTKYRTLISMNITFPAGLIYEFELIDDSGKTLGISRVYGGTAGSTSIDTDIQSRTFYLGFDHVYKDTACITVYTHLYQRSSITPMNNSSSPEDESGIIKNLTFDLFLK